MQNTFAEILQYTCQVVSEQEESWNLVDNFLQLQASQSETVS